MFDVRQKHTTAAQRERSIANLTQVLGQVDRTLTGSMNLQVNGVSGDERRSVIAPAPAWSVLEKGTPEIWIDFTSDHFSLYLEGNESFAYAIGLNYHELAHHMFTPTMDDMSARMQSAIKNDTMFRQAWNILEDARIERLLRAQYRTAHKFIWHALLIALPGGDDADNAWALFAPRVSELPQHFVESVRGNVKAFNRKQIARMEQIGVEYKQLVFSVFSGDFETPYRLISEYAKLLTNAAPNFQHGLGGHTGSAGSKGLTQHGDDPVWGTGSHTESDQSKAQKDAKASESAESAAKRAERAKERQQGAQSRGEGSGGKGSGDGSGDVGGDAKDDNAKPTKKGFSTKRGKPNNQGDPGKAQTMRSSIQEALAEVMADSEVQSDIKSAGHMMRSGRYFKSRVKARASGGERPVTSDMAMSANRISKEFRKLEEQLDPGYDRYQQSGKLNVGRFLRERDIETAFDSWREDKSSANSGEVVFYGDLSSSMNIKGDDLLMSQALWVMRRSFDQLGWSMSGYGFSSGASIMFERERKVQRAKFEYYRASGSTVIEPALTDSLPLFWRSKSKTKLAIILSDGQFDGSAGVDKAVKELREQGVIVVVFHLASSSNGGMKKIDKPRYDGWWMVTDTTQMVMAVKELVKMSVLKKAGVK